MPLFAVLDDQIVSVRHIYKHSIPTTSHFKCFICKDRLFLKQQRNADKDFTEHFYHPNTKRGTLSKCETTSFMKPEDDWHTMMSNLVEPRYREIVRKQTFHDDLQNDVKHVVDAYNAERNVGVEFQKSPISADAVRSRDATTHLDWIFHVQRQFIRKVRVGNFAICEVPYDKWTAAIKAVQNHVFLYTGCEEWILLSDRNVYYLEIPAFKQRHVWIGKVLSFDEVWSMCLQHVLTDQGAESLRTTTSIKHISCVDIVYARCKASMFMLDAIHREYVYKHSFENGDVVAVKSVAGSGKTTTLLELAKIRSTDRILYLTFNKRLQTEVEKKVRDRQQANLHPKTFDALIFQLFYKVNGVMPNIQFVTPQTLGTILPSCQDGDFAVRKRLVQLFDEFCGQHSHSSPLEFCRATNASAELSGHVQTLWRKCTSLQVVTFNSMRKMSQVNRWFQCLNTEYDMIMIDEVQDFDSQMLHMLMCDTQSAKLLVGDPRQAIYTWRQGHVNAFEHLPHHALVVEFYSTFRVGEPACEQIRNKFEDCWMVSKSTHESTLSHDTTLLDGRKYTYLFRSWRHLLQTAANTPCVWINDYSRKIKAIRKDHASLHHRRNLNLKNDIFDDDLPRFLTELGGDDLEAMLLKIEENVVPEADCICKMYTIHAFKGLEDECVRLHEDVHLYQSNDKLNLYYVALTRGTQYIVENQTSTS